MTPGERDIQARIREANRRAVPLTVHGTGSRALVPTAGSEILSVAGLNEIQEIDADELRLTVEAGCPLDRIRSALADAGLILAALHGEDLVGEAAPYSLVNGSSGGSIGGWFHDPRPITTRRWGLLRDQVLGVEAYRGDGTPFKAGGRVVKNVTGYDLTRLLGGSRGRFAVVRRLHLRLERAPEASGWCDFEFESPAALWEAYGRLRRAGFEPLGVRITGHPERHLRVVEASRAARLEPRLSRIANTLGGRETSRGTGPATATVPPGDSSSPDDWWGHIHLGARHWPQLLRNVERELPDVVRWIAIFPDAYCGIVRCPGSRLDALHRVGRLVSELRGTITPGRFDVRTAHEFDWPTTPAERSLERALVAEWDPVGVLRSPLDRTGACT